MSENNNQPTTVESGYINGSDMLLAIGTKCVGHCTSHKTNYSSDTTTHQVKAPESESEAGVALFPEESVTGLAITIDFEGLAHNEEEETSMGELRMAWRAGKPVTAKCFKRGNKTSPYLEGSFIITSFSEDYPAQQDTTFSGSLKITGAPTTFTA